MWEMEPIANVFAPYIMGAGLMMLRMTSMLAVVPGFAVGTVPNRIRVMVAVVFTIVMDMGLGGVVVPVPESPFTMGLLGLREVLIGGGMGLALRLVLAGVEAAGAVAGISMGLSLNVFMDPTSGEETMTLGSLMSVCAALIFVAMNGHHLILSALFAHFQQFPVGELAWHGPSLAVLAKAGSKVVLTAMILSAPVVVITLILNASIALVSRVVPSINLFGIGLGLLTFTGFITLVFEGDALVAMMGRVMQQLPDDLWRMSGTLNWEG